MERGEIWLATVEVTAFSVCDISPPQYSNRDRFAEDTTVF